MNKFSRNTLEFVNKKFLNFENVSEPNSDLLVLKIDCPKKSKMGSLIIQTSEENQIWIRISPQYSIYSIDNNSELENIINGVIEEKILFVLGFKKDKWVETTLTTLDYNFEKEKDVNYIIYSWSGILDKTIE